MKKELDKRTLCPCHSGKPYGECCQPYHQGELPDTAVKLMRSRYAAYALSLPDYIIETTHPENSQFSQDAVAWAAKIVEFSKATEFKDLKILEFQEEGVRATVTFVAHLIQNNKDASFTEKSDFEKVKNKWLYKSGQLYRT